MNSHSEMKNAIFYIGNMTDSELLEAGARANYYNPAQVIAVNGVLLRTWKLLLEEEAEYRGMVWIYE